MFGNTCTLWWTRLSIPLKGGWGGGVGIIILLVVSFCKNQIKLQLCRTSVAYGMFNFALCIATFKLGRNRGVVHTAIFIVHPLLHSLTYSINLMVRNMATCKCQPLKPNLLKKKYLALFFTLVFIFFCHRIPHLKILVTHTKVPRSTKDLVSGLRERYQQVHFFFGRGGWKVEGGVLNL